MHEANHNGMRQYIPMKCGLNLRVSNNDVVFSGLM
jgi:hypothetical protein